jgi:hypothetical protein
MANATRWAEEEFGEAELGDIRRTKRLVMLAAEAAGRPSGLITKACRTSASREGAFRLLESSEVRPDDIRRAVEAATLRRCAGKQRVFVAIDGTSLTLSDKSGQRGLGGVGAWDKGARGVQVMTALAMASNGATLGICGQRMWTRNARSPHGYRGALGKQSENRYWLDLLTDSQDAFGRAAPQCQPWFQMDRGADCWQVLALCHHEGMLMTVRAAHDRRVDDAYGRLWCALEHAPVVAQLRVEVPVRPPVQKRKRVAGRRIKYLTRPRRARIAKVTIRAEAVYVQCTTHTGGQRTVPLHAVLVRENRRGDERIEWMLLTTHPIHTRRDVLEVIRGYTLRWRIEEFHRVWKRGLCRIEDTQLQSRNGVFKWATILAAVATRAMRLTHLARATPDALASTEFSRVELKALLSLRKPKGQPDLSSLTLAAAVRWVAELGGYTGPWHGPPGPTVIGRGLYDVLVVARAFENDDKKR